MTGTVWHPAGTPDGAPGAGVAPTDARAVKATVKAMARRALEHAAQRAPNTASAVPHLSVDEPPGPSGLEPPPRDPFEALQALEEALETIIPTASFRWEVHGHEMVLVADLGSSSLRVAPQAGDRLHVTARSTARSVASVGDGCWDPME